MKMRCARIEPNDDGSFQVELEMMDESDEYGMRKSKRYSASSIEDSVSKIKEGMAEIGKMKAEKKEKRKPDKTMAGFVKG